PALPDALPIWVELDLTLCTARIQRAADGVQVGQREHAPSVIAQTDTRVVQVGTRCIDSHINTRPVFSPGVAYFSTGTSCSHCAMAHAGMIHALHVAVIHSRPIADGPPVPADAHRHE